MSGKAAVENAVNGITDKMVGFERSYDNNSNYICNIKLMDLSAVANAEKKVPREWINDKGNGMNQAYLDYVLPLIQGSPKMAYEGGVPRFAKLKKIIAK